MSSAVSTFRAVLATALEAHEAARSARSHSSRTNGAASSAAYDEALTRLQAQAEVDRARIASLERELLMTTRTAEGKVQASHDETAAALAELASATAISAELRESLAKAVAEIEVMRASASVAASSRNETSDSGRVTDAIDDEDGGHNKSAGSAGSAGDPDALLPKGGSGAARSMAAYLRSIGERVTACESLRNVSETQLAHLASDVQALQLVARQAQAAHGDCEARLAEVAAADAALHVHVRAQREQIAALGREAASLQAAVAEARAAAAASAAGAEASSAALGVVRAQLAQSDEVLARRGAALAAANEGLAAQEGALNRLRGELLALRAANDQHAALLRGARAAGAAAVASKEAEKEALAASVAEAQAAAERALGEARAREQQLEQAQARTQEARQARAGLQVRICELELLLAAAGGGGGAGGGGASGSAGGGVEGSGGGGDGLAAAMTPQGEPEEAAAVAGAGAASGAKRARVAEGEPEQG